MRRRTDYRVGGPTAEFGLEDWQTLERAFQSFGTGYTNPENYRWSRRGVHTLQAFNVWRADGRPLRNDEINAMYWFSRGVMLGAGITPIG